MANLNKVLLMGNLTREPQSKAVQQTGTPLCDMAMAVNRRYKTQSGEEREDVIYVDLTAYGNQADYCVKNMVKGSTVYVEGHLRYDSWTDKDTGKNRSKLRVIVDTILHLDRRPSQPAAYQPYPANAYGQGPQPYGYQPVPYAAMPPQQPYQPVPQAIPAYAQPAGQPPTFPQQAIQQAVPTPQQPAVQTPPVQQPAVQTPPVQQPAVQTPPVASQPPPTKPVVQTQPPEAAPQQPPAETASTPADPPADQTDEVVDDMPF